MSQRLFIADSFVCEKRQARQPRHRQNHDGCAWSSSEFGNFAATEADIGTDDVASEPSSWGPVDEPRASGAVVSNENLVRPYSAGYPDANELFHSQPVDRLKERFASRLSERLAATARVGRRGISENDAQSLNAAIVPIRHDIEVEPQFESSWPEILATLSRETLTADELCCVIDEGELLPIPVELRDRILAAWKSVILQHRDTQDSRVLVAVMSAIRKFVAEMPAANLSEIGFLLEPSHSVELPVELELTVAKMVVRKLTANPPQQDNPFPQLDKQLWFLAHDYLRDRFLHRQFIGAVAMEAATALLMARSPHTNAVLEQLQSLSSRWFKEVVSDFAEETIEGILRRHPDESDGPTVLALRTAIESLGVARQQSVRV